MATGENFLERAKPNFEFFNNYRNAIRSVTTSISQLSVFDFGAGTDPYPYSHFIGIQPGQKPVVAYDLSLTPELIARKSDESTIWTNILPKNKQFHLVGAYFSIHHMGDDLGESVRQLAEFGPIIAIADYNYKGKDLETFKQAFISQVEQKELNDPFQGDWEACFAYHSRFGKVEYIKALQDQGFEIVQVGSGKDIANHKFFIIARKAHLK